MARRLSMDEIRRRKAAQAPFRVRARPHAPRAAIDDFDVRFVLLGPRQQRPVAPKAGAGAGLGGAALMPPAITARTAAPRLRHLAEQRADRRKRRFALRGFLLGRQPFWGVGTVERFFAASCWHCCSFSWWPRHIFSSPPGLTRWSMLTCHKRSERGRSMDCRVKPGNDDV